MSHIEHIIVVNNYYFFFKFHENSRVFFFLGINRRIAPEYNETIQDAFRERFWESLKLSFGDDTVDFFNIVFIRYHRTYDYD